MKPITHYSQLKKHRIYCHYPSGSFVKYLFRISYEFDGLTSTGYEFVWLFSPREITAAFSWVCELYELDDTFESYLNLFEEKSSSETN